MALTGITTTDSLLSSRKILNHEEHEGRQGRCSDFLRALRPLIAGIAALAFCAGSLAAGAIKTDRERAGLNGPVQTVAVHWKANHKDEYGGIDERNLGSTTYDEAGNLLVAREITPDFARELKPERKGANATVFRSIMGNVTEHYRFDAGGNLIQLEKWYGDKADGPPDITERMTYDSAGRVSRRESFGKERQRFAVTLFERDATGNVMVEEDSSGDLKPPYPRMHYRYTFDAHGNWTLRLVTRENVPETAYQYRYAGDLYRTITYYK
jgi:YD repeat-containing protein